MNFPFAHAAGNTFAFIVRAGATADARKAANSGHAVLSAFCFYLFGIRLAVLVDAGWSVTAAAANIFYFAVTIGFAAEINFAGL